MLDMTLPSKFTQSELLGLIALSAACLGILANVFKEDGYPVVTSLALSGIAFVFTFCLIRWLGPTFIKSGLKGKDMSKLRAIEMYVYPCGYSHNP